MRLAIALILIREEHDAKLAYNRVEAGIRERQGCGIRRLKLDRLVGAKFLTGDLQHRRIEIGGDQIRRRGGVAPERIIEALAEALPCEFGDDPVSVPLQAIVFEARSTPAA